MKSKKYHLKCNNKLTRKEEPELSARIRGTVSRTIFTPRKGTTGQNMLYLHFEFRSCLFSFFVEKKKKLSLSSCSVNVRYFWTVSANVLLGAVKQSPYYSNSINRKQ